MSLLDRLRLHKCCCGDAADGRDTQNKASAYSITLNTEV